MGNPPILTRPINDIQKDNKAFVDTLNKSSNFDKRRKTGWVVKNIRLKDKYEFFSFILEYEPHDLEEGFFIEKNKVNLSKRGIINIENVDKEVINKFLKVNNLEIKLSGNKLTEVPKFISKLSNLEKLDLSSNNLKKLERSEIPESVKEIKLRNSGVKESNELINIFKGVKLKFGIF